MFYIYVLKSKRDNGWYIGSTKNLDKRLKSHNKGCVKSTKYRRPLELIYSEEYETRESAEKAERYYKSGAGRLKLKNKINKYL